MPADPGQVHPAYDAQWALGITLPDDHIEEDEEAMSGDELDPFLEEALRRSLDDCARAEEQEFETIRRQSLVSSLPVEKWGDNPEEESGAEAECGLCLSEYEKGDLRMVLSCGHAFHESCLSPWLLRSAVATCPICRCEVSTAGAGHVSEDV